MKEEFLKELKQLFNKYKITFQEIDDYAGDENFCGQQIYLKNNAFDINIYELEDL